MAGSIEDYNRAREIDPNLAAAYSNRSRAKFELGKNHVMPQDFHDATQYCAEYLQGN